MKKNYTLYKRQRILSSNETFAKRQNAGMRCFSSFVKTLQSAIGKRLIFYRISDYLNFVIIEVIIVFVRI